MKIQYPLDRTFSKKIIKTIASVTAISCSLIVSGCSQDVAIADTNKNSLAPSPSYTKTFTLGDTATLTNLYSYPNNSSGETLAQTIQHYLEQRTARDHIDAEINVSVTADTYSATFTSNNPAISEYKEQIITFLNNGKLAFTGAEQLKVDGKWDDSEWAFFLPVGLSIINQKSVQLLHFPPDYSRTDQDYLNSKTSQRWEQLLQLNEVPADETTLYESILDIAPIAAPASAGSTLSETYSAFEPYVLNMLPLLLDLDKESTTSSPSSTLPIVAYGSPVRDWVADHYQLDSFEVNSVAQISISNGASAPILGANHPSYIWYAKDQSRELASEVMLQDLISSCWQASMGQNPSQNSASAVSNCTSDWQSRPTEVCVNLEIQAYGKTPKEAQQICSSQA